ncbi:MAG: hypothetical protein QNJ94_00845 [Alphaproteobacteria bacterium]|nr:hypothetical protein [Alphaproteobacteria bacterium]
MAAAAAISLSGCSTWQSIVEVVFGDPTEPTPQIIATAPLSGVSQEPLGAVLEPGESQPLTWVAGSGGETPVTEIADQAEQDGLTGIDTAASDDILAEIAAATAEYDNDAPVQIASAGELDDLRGGFITNVGVFAVGFDVKTFVDGVLQVHNVFNMVGDVAGLNEEITQDVNRSLSVQLQSGVQQSGGGGSVSAEQTTGGTPPPSNPAPETQATAAAAEPVSPTVTNVNSPEPFTVEDQLNGGQTTVVTEVGGGTVNTIVTNTASGVSVLQINSIILGVTDPHGFVGTVETGIKTNSVRSMQNSMRDALIGSIAR